MMDLAQLQERLGDLQWTFSDMASTMAAAEYEAKVFDQSDYRYPIHCKRLRRWMADAQESIRLIKADIAMAENKTRAA